LFAVNPAHSAHVIGCNQCATTADFLAAAQNQSNIDQIGGRYMVMSSSEPKTAVVRVTGKFVWVNGETVWRITSAYPTDGSGNSISSYSEGAQEGVYQALDEVIIGSDRSTPGFFWSSPNSAPGPSFTTTSDTAVENWINNDNAAATANMPSGTLVTVTFPDGSEAEYELEVLGGKRVWSWNNKAWNKAHQPINKQGQVIPPQAPQPNNSGGSISIPLQNAQITVNLVGSVNYQGTVTVESIPEDEQVCTSTDAY
jgi:hypothetical protein